MSSEPGTLERLTLLVGDAFADAASSLTSTEVRTLFAELGMALPEELGSDGSLSAALSTATRAAEDLATSVDTLRAAIDGGELAAISAAGVEAISAISAFVAAIDGVADALRSVASTLSGVDAGEVTAFADDLRQRLARHLTFRTLESRYPRSLAIGELFGLASRSTAELSDGQVVTLRSLDLGALGSLIADPGAHFSSLYRWGEDDFEPADLFGQIRRLLRALAIPASLETTERDGEDALSLVGIRLRRAATSPPGIEARLLIDLSEGLTLERALRSSWSIRLTASGALTSDLTATLTPPATLEIDSDASGDIKIGIELVREEGDAPLDLLSALGLVSLSAVGVSFGLAARGASAEILMELTLEDARLSVQLGSADAFLSSFTSASSALSAEFDTTVTWSSRSGLVTSGGAGLTASFGVHASVGPVMIETLAITVTGSTEAIAITATVDLSGSLGPLAISVAGIGIIATASFSDGNLGLGDLAFGFKPPDGLGLVIDAGVVTGGGYLSFDSEDGEYAGVAELSVQDVFSLTVIGLITTQLPDGSEGYSFLFIVAVEFQPIQLGFGFTLNGVGGLAGIGRTMLTDVLAAGIRDHTLDSILFPADPVANAPQIISDLESVFPVDEGRYVFGPMLKIGWGTPSLITAELGVFIELPDPIRIVILGQIDALLPSADAAIVEIHLDSVGVIDFEAGTLAIDASLYDSKILSFALSGDMALRAETGSDPSFALSVGGLNPHFDPPAGFPELRRLTLSLGTGDNPRLSCESYLALTSNTVQFGSAIDAYAEAAGFAVSGHLGFDVLFVLSPFSFIADMDADVALLMGDTELMSVALDVSLSGPTPWHADGKATAKVCGFKVSVSFDKTWGSSEDATLPSGDARTPLLAALADTRSWVVALPADTEVGATIGSLMASEGAILVHPLGTLSVKQSVAPLNVTIERFGSTTPADWDRFEISEVALGGATAATSTVEDDFAPAQFFEMTDSEKLSSPSYEEMDAGVSIGSDDAIGGHTATLEVEYEEYIVDDRALPARMLGLYGMPASVFGSLLRQGAGELSLVRSTGAKKYVTVGTASPIATESVRHVVSSTSDLSIRTDIVASGTSRSAANAALEEYLALHPAERGALQVVPAFEAAA